MSAPEKKFGNLMGSHDNKDDHYNHKSGINQIPNKDILSGEGINLEIINQYGQLMGEFSRLDDELWLTSPVNVDCNTVSPNVNMVDLELLAKCAENSVSLGGMTSASNDSSTLRDFSEDKSLTSSPISVLKKRSYNKVMPMATKSARRNLFAKGDARTSSATAAYELFLLENHVEPFVLDELTDSSPPKLVRTRKISDLLQLHPEESNQNPTPETALKQKLEVESVKRYIHCHSTNTSQWRNGPMGRKTLCNACGIEFKKFGRLVPGYCPLRSSPYSHSDFPNITEKRTNSTAKVKNDHPRKKFDSSEVVQNCTREPKIVQETTEETSDLVDPDFRLRKRKPIFKSTRKRILKKGSVKKCLHCESVKTPQWREGPLGRNTLCNACGLQYKHGRLFPEYRPLKSPTYDPSVHSHLPEKVQQMRMEQISEKSAISCICEQPA